MRDEASQFRRQLTYGGFAFAESENLAAKSMDYPEQQAAYDRLVERWGSFAHSPFPRGMGGAEVDGVCLVVLDSDIAELIQAFVNRRQLRPGGVEVLRRLHGALRRILPSLTDEAVDYFRELHELAAGTLSLLDHEHSK